MVKTFFWSSSNLGAKSLNFYIRFVYFHLLNFCLFLFFNCASGAKMFFSFRRSVSFKMN